MGLFNGSDTELLICSENVSLYLNFPKNKINTNICFKVSSQVPKYMFKVSNQYSVQFSTWILLLYFDNKIKFYL